MSHPPPAVNLLDSVLDALTRQPKNILLLLAILMAAFFSLPCLVMALVASALMRLLKVSPTALGWVSAWGVLLAIAAWLIAGAHPLFLHQQSVWLIKSLMHRSGSLPLFPMIGLALPTGIFLGALFTWITHLNRGLENELQRVAQGQMKSTQRLLSPKKRQRLLQTLTSAACPDGTLLGIDLYRGKNVQLTDHDANLHTLAIGTTGSGKTTGIANVIESAIRRGYPLIYVDGKGDLALADRVKHFATQQGRVFYRFSMVGESLAYNPIAFGGFTSKKDRIIELRQWSEDHYRKIAEGYLQTVFRLLEKAQVPIDLHSLSAHLQPQALYEIARQLGDKTLVAEVGKREAHVKDISSLIAEIDNIAQSEIGYLFDCRAGEVLTLERALKDNAIVYFCLQPLAFPAYAETLGKLIINDIKAMAASFLARQEKIKLFTIFDEFSVFAGDQIINLINQGRGAGIHALLATQSLSDILHKGGEALLGQVLNNTNNYLIQRQNNPNDAEVLANVIGTAPAFQITSQIQAVSSQPAAGSVRESREFIVHPDTIKRLSLGQAIVVNKQHFQVTPIQVRKGQI